MARALSNLFLGPLKESQEGKRVFLVLDSDKIDSLERFRMIIQRDRIRAAAAAVLHKSSGPDGFLVFLNKQVAFVNHVSFCEPEGESPLGPIRFEVQTIDPFKVINWITGGKNERLTKAKRASASIIHELNVDSEQSDPGLEDEGDQPEE